MIGHVQLAGVEKKLLLQHYRKAQNALIRERAHAVLLNSEGKGAYEVSRLLYRTEKTVRGWIKRFHKERISSVFPRYDGNQNAAKLTRKQKKEIKEVLSRSPSKYGLPEEFWEVSTLRKYIKASFGVEYESDESYRLVLKLCNYSYHLPAKVDKKRDEKAIDERMEEIYEEIIPLLEDDKWVVLVSDESRIIWETLIRKAWLPKGKWTVLKVNTQRKSQSFLGALNLRNGKPHIYRLSWQNQEEVIEALVKLKKEYPEKKVCIIWDNAGFHRGNKIKEELKRGGKLYGIHLISLPPYAPDKNPQEHVWKYAKEEIANEVYGSFEKLIREFERIVMGRFYPYQI